MTGVELLASEFLCLQTICRAPDSFSGNILKDDSMNHKKVTLIMTRFYIYLHKTLSLFFCVFIPTTLLPLHVYSAVSFSTTLKKVIMPFLTILFAVDTKVVTVIWYFPCINFLPFLCHSITGAGYPSMVHSKLAFFSSITSN